MNRRRFLGSAAALSLASCGGGGSSVQFIGVPPPAVPRHDILYGYFGDAPGQALEVAGHTNLYLAAPWYGLDGQRDNILAARALGLTQLVIMVDADVVGTPQGAVLFAKTWLMGLRATGCLAGMTVRALYWRDEPNDNTWLPVRDDAYVRATNAGMRSMLAADFPELGPVGMWTIFADRPDLPGLGDWDGAGGDRYGQGCDVLGGGALIDRIGRGLKGGAGQILVPGGTTTPDAGPLLDPSCFASYAEGVARVLAVIPFIWIDGWGSNPANRGIRSVSREIYKALGKRLTGKA